MNCPNARDQFVADVEGLLDDPARASLHAHLGACAACRQEHAHTIALRTRLLDAGRLALSDGVISRIGGRPPHAPPLAPRILRWAIPLAAAAGLALAVALPLNAPPAASAAPLASMTSKIQQAASVAFRIAQVADGQDLRWARFIVVDARLQRAELDDGRVVVADLDQETALVLMPDRMWATHSPLKSQQWHFFPILTGLANLPGELVGEEPIDGQAARVIRAPAPDDFAEGTVTVWISVRTGLPLRIRHDPSPLQTREGPMLGPSTVMDHFEFGGAYNPGLFSLQVPPGYALQPPIVDTMVATNQASQNARAAVLAVHDYFAKHGAYPPSLQALIDASMLDAQSVVNPRQPGASPGFVYFAPAVEAPFEAAIIFEPVDPWPGTGVVAFLDGHTEVLADEARYRQLLDSARRRAGEP